MMMEIVLSEQKADEYDYSIERCYQSLDNYFCSAGIKKVSHGVYHCSEFGKMSVAQCVLSETEWFMKVVEQWYCRYKSDSIQDREDCMTIYKDLITRN